MLNFQVEEKYIIIWGRERYRNVCFFNETTDEYRADTCDVNECIVNSVFKEKYVFKDKYIFKGIF